jgi:prepilin signal peptidase PulO-like enzyme (type II secretory pathway)
MQVLITILFVLAGFACGAAIWLFFRRMPTAWLLDYDESEISPELRDCQRLRFWPEAVLLMAADGLVFLLGWHFLGIGLELPAVLLAAQPLLLIIVADLKTRIIPDQFVIALLPCAALLWIADSIAGDPGWLVGLLYRVLGGLAGGAVLFLAGWIGEKVMHREAMGMGDVKLLAAAGLMSSIRLLPLLLVLSFFTAAFVALPMLLRRLRDPESGSDMAFGPFIALATLVVLLLSRPIAGLWDLYLGLLV